MRNKTMSDIELVIKISEDSYNATCNGCMLPSDVDNIVQGIKNGTILPKGHGKLKDVDKLNRKDVNCANVPMNFIDAAETIIEADEL